MTDLDGRMSADPTSGSKGDSSVALKHKLHEIILVDKPRHLVDQKEDLERLFPRCPPNTLESVAKVNKKNKRRNLNTLNNNCQLEAGKESLNQVGKIIDLVSLFELKHLFSWDSYYIVLHLVWRAFPG